MTRRRSPISTAVLLVAGLVALPACQKDKPGGGGEPEPGPVPPAASSEYVLFARLNATDVLDNPLFAELQQAVEKAGGAAEWDKAEQDFAGEIGGIKPTEFESATLVVTEVLPENAPGIPTFVAIITTGKPVGKVKVGPFKPEAPPGPAEAGPVVRVIGFGPEEGPDARGFYLLASRDPLSVLVHFPDDKTVVLLHSAVAPKYLDGYAKDRTGWPLTGELTTAAAGHTLFATANLQKLPRDVMDPPVATEFVPLLKARSLTLTADLKGKELRVAARAGFPDAAAAGQARDAVRNVIGMALGEIDKEKKMTGPELPSLMPMVQEAHRALKEAKVEASGSDLTAAGSYRVDFDIAAMVADIVPKHREAAARSTARHNLHQIGLALHNYDSVNNQVPILGVGPNGQPPKNPKDKLLLSWRVAMLPYIEQGPLYTEFHLDEPWDSPHNKTLIEKMPKIYAPVRKPGQPGYTHLQMVVGPGAMDPPVARFPGSFPDGMSNTIAVVEAAEPVIWTKPDDVMLTGKELPKDLRKKFGRQFPGGFNVVMWDGSARIVRDSVSDRTLCLLINPADGQPIPDDW
jgi:hypothetical protein